EDATSHASRCFPRSLADLDGVVEKDLELRPGGERHGPCWPVGPPGSRARDVAIDRAPRDPDPDGVGDEAGRRPLGAFPDNRAALVVVGLHLALDVQPEGPVRVLGLALDARLAAVGKERGVEAKAHATGARARAADEARAPKGTGCIIGTRDDGRGSTSEL